MWACGCTTCIKSNELLHEGDSVQQLTNLAKGHASSRLMCNIIKWPEVMDACWGAQFPNRVPSSVRVRMGAQLPQKVQSCARGGLFRFNNYNWYELKRT